MRVKSQRIKKEKKIGDRSKEVVIHKEARELGVQSQERDFGVQSWSPKSRKRTEQGRGFCEGESGFHTLLWLSRS